MNYDIIDSPIGPLLLAADHSGLRYVDFLAGPALSAIEGPALSAVEGPALSAVEGPARNDACPEPVEGSKGPGSPRSRAGWTRDPKAVLDAARQLSQYFAGKRKTFDLQLAPEGTPFRRATWRALEKIPYGETISYGQLARRIGKPAAARAVGAAVGANPLAIVIPCHRVIGADGSLTGFGGGLPIKRALLQLEGWSGGAVAAASGGAVER
ncbi:MAG: methylated-DNA--[protein]-cysteine S-methyltransferase [Deltaproteobacteria bacterium]|nr:methylated-DNA--[protein]-cysteine S-methyltransferase [Deltaproteobacteria bacterium]